MNSILLVSCYELGHQPSALAVPLGFLRRAGIEADAIDLSVQPMDMEKARNAAFIGISVPMHTALRIGTRVAQEIRKLNAHAHICFYGHYAALNAQYLLENVADTTIGGEYEQPLIDLIKTVIAKGEIDIAGVSTRKKIVKPYLARLDFPAPERGALPALKLYARLAHGGEERLAGYVEASRGCLHNCTHCPIPPVYGGRFFVLPVDVVMADIRALVAAGARHITFGDPDFLNGPGHALRVVRALHAEFPALTFDFTAKVEHIIKQHALMPEFAESGCLFVVSAVESLSDSVLAHLEKGHTREDIYTALEIMRAAGITLRPSFVPFTPWATIEDYIDLLEFVESEALIYHVDPVQYTIRLLVPPGSLLLDRPDSQRWLGPLAQESFTYEWSHPDARMDRLWTRVTQEVEQAVRANSDNLVIFNRIRELAYAIAQGSGIGGRGNTLPPTPDTRTPTLDERPPRLTEAWFC